MWEMIFHGYFFKIMLKENEIKFNFYMEFDGA